MRNSIRLSVLALAAAALAFSTGAYAADTQTANLTVNATVAADCTISAATLNFGNYFVVANASAPLNGSTTVNYVCPSGVTGTILLNEGASPASGSTLASPLRQMKHGTADFLAYNLYSDHSGGLVWDGVTGIGSLAGTGSSASVTVYGQVAAGQSPTAAAYTDTVVATITYF